MNTNNEYLIRQHQKSITAHIDNIIDNLIQNNNNVDVYKSFLNLLNTNQDTYEIIYNKIIYKNLHMFTEVLEIKYDNMYYYWRINFNIQNKINDVYKLKKYIVLPHDDLFKQLISNINIKNNKNHLFQYNLIQDYVENKKNISIVELLHFLNINMNYYDRDMLTHILDRNVICCESELYVDTFIETYNYNYICDIIKFIPTILQNYSSIFTI